MSKRRNKKIKDLIARGIIADSGKAKERKQQTNPFVSHIRAWGKKQHWKPNKELKDNPSIDWHKARSGVIIKQKRYKVYDKQ